MRLERQKPAVHAAESAIAVGDGRDGGEEDNQAGAF
jgi:hypothetical protein